MGLVISLSIHNYLIYKKKDAEEPIMCPISRKKVFGYIELISTKIDKNDKHIIFNNNING